MEIKNELELHTRAQLRNWLQEYHTTEKVAWIVVNRGKTPIEGVISYLDLVEEVLCFGWIDSTLKKKNENETLQRITPRSKNSPWSELNKERVRRLKEIGMMTPAGEQVVPRDEQWCIPTEIIERLQKEEIYEIFTSFSLLYQKVRLDGIIGLPEGSEIYTKRLEKLIIYTKKNEYYGQWNDGGKLHEGPYTK